ncbi:MAG TPA: hypothetical protein VM243_15845 [Phycisphaerae bacterium]|nr:hypothetical protein [Phycisphaerae bacterium]
MRKPLLCLCCLGLLAAAAPADGPTLQIVKNGKFIAPAKIGRLAPDGTVSEWVQPGTRGCDHRLVFDCFEPDVGGEVSGYDGYPIGYGSCGYGEPEANAGNRWYFGSTYYNMYASNDMEFDPSCGGMSVSRFEVAWWWQVNGAGTGENCAVLVETFEDFDDTCQTGDPNGMGEFLGGVITLFGYSNGDPGYYLYTDVDLCDLEWLSLPADGAGGYNIWLLTYVGDDPNYPDDFSLATCAQPMVWGTGTNEWPTEDCVNRGLGPCPYPDGPGDSSHQGVVQWDDDEIDGWHTAPYECYDLTYGLCPDPLGAMACFYVDGPCGGCMPGDVDGDGDVDHSDLGALLSAWCSHEGDPNWNPNADFDGDGHVGHGDLGVLLANWG